MINANCGDIFTQHVQAYVNPVNCIGVAGKGLALRFKQQFPTNYDKYRLACMNKELYPGKVLIDKLPVINPEYIISFPTKIHWIHPSQYTYITSGLQALIAEVVTNNISSIAIPALGCGLGGLSWNKVKPLIIEAFAGVPYVEVRLCG